MSVVEALKFLYENKVLAAAPGWVAIILIGVIELFQIEPLHAELVDVKQIVKSLQISQYEERLDAAYAGLCMSPGDQEVLQRIRELQYHYYQIQGARYTPPGCGLLMKIR